MQLKQYLRYQMDFSSKWVRNSAFLIGLSFFARILYSFVFSDVTQFSVGTWIFQLILPLLACISYIVLIRLVKWNAPGVYAILGTVLCLFVIVWNFSSGNILRVILSILFYTAASVALLGTAAGFFPGKFIPSIIFAALFAFRMLFYFPVQSGIGVWVLEISVLSIIASLYSLPMGFVPIVSMTDDEPVEQLND